MEPKKIVMKGSMRRMAREFFDNLAKAASEASSPSLETSNGTEGPFQYTPLTSVSNFRLLHLKREFHPHTVDDTNMPLRGSLVEASIDAPREYYALSYTWGDPALCDSIVIDGRRLRITASCAGALRRMLRGKAHRYIWVDSICINQANTTEALEERGRQVAMMGDIYRKAVQVNVHLGEGDPASDVAIVALNKLATFYAGAKLPGPQREFFRRQYESLADDVLGEKALQFDFCCYSPLSTLLNQLFSSNARVSIRKVTRRLPFAMVQSYLGKYKHASRYGLVNEC